MCKVTFQSDSPRVDRMEEVDSQEHSNEFFCALLLNRKEWTARTIQTVGIIAHLPSREKLCAYAVILGKHSQRRVSDSDGSSRNAPWTHVSQESHLPLNSISSVKNNASTIEGKDTWQVAVFPSTVTLQFSLSFCLTLISRRTRKRP